MCGVDLGGNVASIYVGCAGWNLRKEFADQFPGPGTHLERYAQRFNAVEINSSFYRSHRTNTYKRWAASTPEGFRFSVKVPKQITHVQRLVGVDQLVVQFASEIAGLGTKLGVVLVQLPPSLKFDSASEEFFQLVKREIAIPITCEPRHPTWFTNEAQTFLRKWNIERVAADPAVVAVAAIPGGLMRDCYFRWHGSPRMYYSNYEEPFLADLVVQLKSAAQAAQSVWCIFDNTADGFATLNALRVRELI